MSDDDCDIFSMPTKALPRKLLVPDQETDSTDYDFIEISAEIKKPTKVTRVKQAAPVKSRGKTGKLKRQQKDEESHAIEQELATTSPKQSPQEAQAPPARDLSPVSQMIYEMEQNRAKEKVDDSHKSQKINAKEQNRPKEIVDDNLPIARRTRSSLGGGSSVPEKVQEAATGPSPPKQQKRNVRKKAAAPKSNNTPAPIQTAPKPTRQLNIEFPSVSRGSRRQVAEMTARLPVTDSIDLVSAVMPRIEGFVNLDSEDENSMVEVLEKYEALNQSFKDDNPELAINLSWLGEIQIYKLRQHQKFLHLFKEISERNKVAVDDILINLDDRLIKPTESPDNVGLKIYHVLSGCATQGNKKKVETIDETNLLLKPRKFQLKVQGDKWKKPLIIPIKKTDTFRMLYIKCSEEMECDVQDFKLFFDGELLELDDTPKNQDMEGNEMIDLRMK